MLIGSLGILTLYILFINCIDLALAEVPICLLIVRKLYPQALKFIHLLFLHFPLLIEELLYSFMRILWKNIEIIVSSQQFF